jgi:hypothetical protein
MDPADVYRVKLKKGDRFKVTVRLPSGATAALAFGARTLARVRGGSVTLHIKRSGTYFVGLTLGKSPEAGVSYTLTLKR